MIMQLSGESSTSRMRSAGNAGSGPGRPASARWPIGRSPDLERHGESEHAALAELALDPDPPAHEFHQALRDRQPKPRAAEPPGGGKIGLREALEDPRQFPPECRCRCRRP